MANYGLNTRMPGCSGDMAGVCPAGGTITVVDDESYSMERYSSSAPAGGFYGQVAEAPPYGRDLLATMASGRRVDGLGRRYRGYSYDAPPMGLDLWATLASKARIDGARRSCGCDYCTAPPIGRDLMATLASRGRGNGPCRSCGCYFCAAPGATTIVCGYCSQRPEQAGPAAADGKERFKGWLPW